MSRLEVLVSTIAGVPTLLNVWTVFWIQLPVLVRVVAAIIVAIVAMRRSRPEDVPKIIETVITVFTSRIDLPARLRRRRVKARVQTKPEGSNERQGE